MIFGFASCVWMSSLTRSMGAVHVFAMAPDTPPMAKSVRKATALNSSFFAGMAIRPVASYADGAMSGRAAGDVATRAVKVLAGAMGRGTCGAGAASALV